MKKIKEEYSVSLVTDEQGTKWIRIKAMGEDFSLSLFNMKDGDKEDFTWEEAMKFAESHGQEMPSKNQWMLVDMLRKDIDKLIEDNGGDPLERWYWSKDVSQSYSNSAWLYYSNYGALHYDYKCISGGGRLVINAKDTINGYIKTDMENNTTQEIKNMAIVVELFENLLITAKREINSYGNYEIDINYGILLEHEERGLIIDAMRTANIILHGKDKTNRIAKELLL